MSRTQKKLEIYTHASLQATQENSAEENVVTAADDYIEVTLERKKEADKPLYLKRV